MKRAARERERLANATGVKKHVKLKYKGTLHNYVLGTVEDEVSVIDNDYKHVIQRIELDDPKTAREWGVNLAYRHGYFTLSKKRRKLTWGQYHSIIPAPAYRQLIQKAKRKGWLGLSNA
jgi:hypothetical protein